MRLDYWKNPTTGTRNIQITIPESDIADIGPEFFKRHKLELDYLNRSDASIEEKLMALQIIARGIDEATSKVS